jgi:hypothetical protein
LFSLVKGSGGEDAIGRLRGRLTAPLPFQAMPANYRANDYNSPGMVNESNFTRLAWAVRSGFGRANTELPAA